jgi:hypothetical protein
MTVDHYDVSRDGNDGSRDDVQNNGYDEARYQSRDKRAETWTTFTEYDIEQLDVSHYRKRELKRMRDIQEGIDYGEAYPNETDRKDRKQQNREEWRRRMVETFASQIGMTTHQHKRAEHIMMNVFTDAYCPSTESRQERGHCDDCEKKHMSIINSFGPYATEEVIVAVINVVCREDGWMVEDDDDFIAVVQSVVRDTKKPKMDRLKRLRKNVRDKIDMVAKL